MGFKTSFEYQGNRYSVVFAPRPEGNVIKYTVVVGDVGSADQKILQLVPDTFHESPILYWKEDVPDGSKGMDPHFIQAIGWAIESHDE
jgi:hypothetical protein